jgi:hypothetical protein
VGTYPGAGWQLGPQPLVIPPSPTPLSLTGLISAGVSALGSLLFGTPPTIATTLQPPGPIDVIATVHNALTVIERSGQLCTVFASTKQYDSMAITSVSCERNKLGSMVFKVELKRVNIVATASVAAPKPLIVAAVPPKAAGPQTPAPMSSAEKASILKQGLNAVVGGIAGGG